MRLWIHKCNFLCHHLTAFGGQTGMQRVKCVCIHWRSGRRVNFYVSAL